VLSAAPDSVGRISSEVRDNLEQVLDLEHLVISRLASDKALLTRCSVGSLAARSAFSTNAVGACVVSAARPPTGNFILAPLAIDPYRS
jgi:hypothetical protein